MCEDCELCIECDGPLCVDCDQCEEYECECFAAPATWDPDDVECESCQ